MVRIRSTALAALLLASLAACGEKAEEPGVASAGRTPSASASAVADTPADYAKFESYLKENGLDIENMGDLKPEDSAAIEEASQKCRQFLPNGGELPELSPQDREKILQFSRCMRENGVPDFPDPPADGSIDPDAPQPKAPPEVMEKAVDACAKHIPVDESATPRKAG